MACCFNVACFFCTLCVFIGLAGLGQLGLGIYFTFFQTDIVTVNHLIKTNKFDSYLAYILLIFVGLGFISLILSFVSIFGILKRNRSLSLFTAVLWVFAVVLNLVIFAVLFLYYYLILPQLHPLVIRSLQQSPSTTSNLLDNLQSKYQCCGINGKDDYNNLRLDPLPSSCCRVPNCWQDSNNTESLMHSNGCYPIVEKYVTIELWILISVTGLCALLQILAIALMCILNQRYKKFDNNPKFVISHLGAGVPINANANNIQGSSKTIEETVEITQI